MSQFLEMSNREYIARFGKDKPLNMPEWDRGAQTDFLNSVNQQFGSLLDVTPTVVVPELNNLAIERILGWDRYDLYMGSTLVHPYVDLNLTTMIEKIDVLHDLAATYSFVPDPFLPKDFSYHNQDNLQAPAAAGFLLDLQSKVVLTDSPVVDLRSHDWDAYLKTLNGKRRYKVKEALTDFGDKLDVKVVNTLTTSQIDWLLDQTKKYWTGVHADKELPYVHEYALLQILWGIEASKHYKTWFVVAEYQGVTLSICSFVRRHDSVYFNSFSRSADHLDLCRNIGPFMLATAVQHLLTVPDLNWLDATCFTSFDNPEYNVYKRLVCNTPMYLPSIAVVNNASPVALSEIYPPMYLDGAWVSE